MSMEHEELVKCSQCGHEDGFVIWQSLNATLNPEAKADMMESCLFEHKCPKCGHVDSYTYDLLYHDMESMFMIQLCEAEDRVADYIAMFDDFSKKTDDLIKMDDDYKLRLVDSRNNLREKVYIFDQGLDDRIIELMKLFIRFDISQENPEHEVDEIFLEISDDVPTRFAICLTDGQWGSVPFNQEVYDRIKEEMIDPEDNGKRDYIVNMQWAGECIHNMAEKLNE